MIVMLDAGHGGRDSGAVGPSAVPEKDIALAVTLQIGGFLNVYKGVQRILYTRVADIYIPLARRCEWANKASCDVFVSIHCNAAEDPRANGYEFWTSPGYTPADALASEMWRSYRAAFPGKRGRLDSSDGDEDKEARFAVLVGTEMPAVLVELGFITNTEEEQWLLNPATQWKAATALSSAIYDWGRDHGIVKEGG